MLIEVYLICHINCMFALTLIMEMSYTTIKELMNLVEQVQYKAALIVSGCWQGTNREKLNEELGWESLADRRWFRRLNLFYKISNGLVSIIFG